MEEKKDWIVRYYNKKDELIGSAVIHNRTKADAEEEVIMYAPIDCVDDNWTLTEK